MSKGFPGGPGVKNPASAGETSSLPGLEYCTGCRTSEPVPTATAPMHLESALFSNRSHCNEKPVPTTKE